MIGKVLSEAGKRVILLGNEAIARGALEAGISLASTYPGTPATEIGDTFSAIARQAGIYFEYSTNEKVALEVAAGAALSGVRSIVSFKHYGLNVACDSVMPLAFFGVTAGMAIVVADDPSCWSSAQSEQDSRYFAFMSYIPMIEPSDPQECKDLTKLAFEISEKFKSPIFIRLTTRVSHANGVVKLGKLQQGKKEGFFLKDPKRYFSLPPRIIEMHKELIEKLENIRKFSEKTKINFLVNDKVKSRIGIITSGASFNYVMEAMDDLKIKLPVLKLGMTYPLPNEKVKKFIKRFNSVLVVEELEPILEKQVCILAKDANPKLKVFGKELIPRAGELNEELVIKAIAEITGKKGLENNLKNYLEKYKELKFARRFPLLCPGCPHRAVFYAAKEAAGKDTIFVGDVGCYILGVFPPLEAQDFLFSMGASQGLIHGIKKVSRQKAIAFIGDSTFFHAGIPGLINIVYNRSNPLVIVLDNRITAMTGHQPNPGVGITGMGDATNEISIENIVKAIGIENVRVVDSYNLKEMEDTIKEFMSKESASVIIAKRECRLLSTRKMRKAGVKVPVFEIDQDLCNKCGKCLNEFACPAISKKGGKFYIDKDLCWGCAVCVQICPNKAIRVVQ